MLKFYLTPASLSYLAQFILTGSTAGYLAYRLRRCQPRAPQWDWLLRGIFLWSLVCI